jgi:hypothetical protein
MPRTLCVFFVALTATMSAQSLVTIYVGPQTKDGFADVDQGVLDSIKDLRAEFGCDKTLRVVDTPDRADAVLHVVARTMQTKPGGLAMPIAGTGITSYIPNSLGYLETILRVGTVEKKDARAWLAANRQALERGRLATPVAKTGIGETVGAGGFSCGQWLQARKETDLLAVRAPRMRRP